MPLSPGKSVKLGLPIYGLNALNPINNVYTQNHPHQINGYARFHSNVLNPVDVYMRKVIPVSWPNDGYTRKAQKRLPHPK